jgi:hypothetical protein
VAKRDERQIKLDPMEWRDAMKDVAGGSKKPPGSAKAKATKAKPAPKKK